MSEQSAHPTTAAQDSELESMRKLLQVQTEQQRISQEAEAARQVRLQMCEYLLDAGLAASKLPAPMQTHVKEQFSGKVFEPADLTKAIDAARELVSSLTGAASVTGPTGRIPACSTAKTNSRPPLTICSARHVTQAPTACRPPRLSGVRELYLMLTGDDDLHGGFYPSRVRLATTADFTGLVKNALNKIVVNQWQELGRAGYDWWTRITAQRVFNSLQGITGTLVGTVGTLPVVAEGAEYTELAIGDSPETASFVKYGGYIPLTLELIDRDETRKLQSLPPRAGQRRPPPYLRPGCRHLHRQLRHRPHHGRHRRAVQCHRRYHRRRACQPA